MAKLAIYRGDTLDREIDLSPRTARIGRSDQNEIVLPDPAKSVSRFHAELRFEDGQYVIVDLNSQNGTWVAGKRVQQIALEPGSPVVVGTYRLVLVPDPAAPVDSDKTMVISLGPPAPKPQAAPAPAPAAPAPPGNVRVAAAPPPVKAEESRPAAPAPPPPPKPEPPKAEAPKPAPPPAPAPPPKPAAPPPPKAVPAGPPAPASVAPAPKPAPPKPVGKGGKKMLVVAAVVLLVVGGVAAGLFLWPSSAPAPQAQPAGQQAQATPAPVPGGPPTETPAPPPGQPPAAATPAAAAPPAATPPVEPAAKAAPVRPARTPASGTSAGSRREATPPRAKVAPEPKARPINVGQALEQARSAMISGEYLSAMSTLEAVLKASPGNPDASQMLDLAKSGARNAAQLAVDTGTKSEMSADYDAAIKQYEKAQQLDPGSQSAADAMRRVRGRMQADGEDAFKRAKQFDALGRSSDAIGMYEKAVRLLPPDHASSKAAKERLAALKGGN